MLVLTLCHTSAGNQLALVVGAYSCLKHMVILQTQDGHPVSMRFFPTLENPRGSIFLKFITQNLSDRCAMKPCASRHLLRQAEKLFLAPNSILHPQEP